MAVFFLDRPHVSITQLNEILLKFGCLVVQNNVPMYLHLLELQVLLGERDKLTDFANECGLPLIYVLHLNYYFTH